MNQHLLNEFLGSVQNLVLLFLLLIDLNLLKLKYDTFVIKISWINLNKYEEFNFNYLEQSSINVNIS